MVQSNIMLGSLSLLAPVSLKIKFPQDLSDEQRTKLKTLFEGRSYW